MLKNYLSIFLHRLGRQRLYSAVNLLGLVVGIAGFLLILLFVRHELGFDGYHEKAGRIVRISQDFLSTSGGPDTQIAAMPPGAAPLLKQDFPQIEEVGRISQCSSGDVGALFTSENGEYYEPGYATGDNSLFQIFDFEWLAGDPASALLEPYTIVVTESVAQRHFGSASAAFGQTLRVEGNFPVEITGVIADLPSNTHLDFSMLLSFRYGEAQLGPEIYSTLEGFQCYVTYALLHEGAGPADLQRQSGAFFPRHLGEERGRFMDFTVQALEDIHLHSNKQGEMKPPGSMALVQTFSAIGLFILLIACINFINLSTARAVKRAKEVGIRKVMGGSRRQMIAQFIGESLLMALAAVLLAVLLLEAVLPVFSAYLQAELGFDYFGDPAALPILVSVVLAVGALAGSYPAFYLSAFNPTRVLKGDVTRGTASITFRKILVVLQFSISISLVIATLVVYQQLQYARNIELGFEKDRIVVMTSSPTRGLGNQWEAMKQEWLAHPEIIAVTASQYTPGSPDLNQAGVSIEGGPPEPLVMAVRQITFEFFETYEIDLLAGRGFSEDFGGDVFSPGQGPQQAPAANIVINELAARQLGHEPETILNRSINIGGIDATVVGVVENVYWESIHSAIRPAIYVIQDIQTLIANRFRVIRSASIRISGQRVADTLAHIDAVWERFLPEQPITRRFLNQDFEALYQSEERQGRLFFWFASLAVFIACLGLFGLSWYSTEQRSKEIGVRKVMGGSNWHIVRLFTAESSRHVLLANLIAWPLSWFFMRRWLENFAYRIDLGLAVFAGSALLALLIAWLTVGSVSARAAGSNPVKVLRYE